jgi:alkylation response protein AidB-like acyl-CoA dehydrogenase
VQRWVPSALNQEIVWCQLFSEPEAGSDAAGIRMKATKVEGGWQINGQKVWTSGAHIAGRGMITVRTDPDAPKHNGITVMVVDMKAPGVEVRPLRQTTGNADFNEVFFNDVFVPDEDVVGAINDGWTVARATLGNESVSIGGGGGGMAMPAELLIPGYDAHPERLTGGATRLGNYIVNHQAMGLINLRSVVRAVSGGGPSPEGAVTKLVLSELGHEAAAIELELAGPDIAFVADGTERAAFMILMNRGMSIAGGTSEIKRNQIGERLLGLPRDPLLSK